MAPKGRGYKVTPPLVLELLKKAVAEKSQYAVAKDSGLALSVIQGLLKGNREPSTSTLYKLEQYFNLPADTLRMGSDRIAYFVENSNSFNEVKNKFHDERLEEAKRQYGILAQEVFDKIRLEGVDLFECAFNDIVKKAQLESLRELVKCRDQSKK